MIPLTEAVKIYYFRTPVDGGQNFAILASFARKYIH